MSLLSLFDVAGRFHPVLVHLPIGILLLACLFQLLAMYKKFEPLRPAIQLMLFLGVLSAIASCITGILLSQSGDYEETLVSRHQWLGIGVMFASLALYLLHRSFVPQKVLSWASLLLLGLIMITGHLGGSLTHGSAYLTEGFDQNDEPKGPAIKPIVNVPEAVVYADMVEPLLKARCYSCHGPNKMKGKLRLDGPELILKGGKTGKTVLPGKPGESELFARLMLPLDDEDHMPPKEKTQLTPHELELLHWWISTGADFTRKTKELPQTEKIKPMLLALQPGAATGTEKIVADVPAEKVSAAEEGVIKSLKAAGVTIVAVAAASNYLSANFMNAAATDSTLKLLTALKPQLVWLNLAGAVLTDKSMAYISQLVNLRKLNLSNTGITDKGLADLRKLTHLQTLNLVGTKISIAGMFELKNLKELQSIYLYQTQVQAKDWMTLRKTFPGTMLDSGGYSVPTLAKDTTEINLNTR
ncbi:MAG: c-type cytochrome domain-containing protein [Ferruginibacter sp.]|nr:c-type cytochrome domain-containing protein [Ferruginibacter sp.]